MFVTLLFLINSCFTLQAESLVASAPLPHTVTKVTVSKGNPRTFSCGADQLCSLRQFIKNDEPIGILTNQTGKTADGRRTVDALLAEGFSLKKIFVPEHGLDGMVPAEHKVSDQVDEKTQLPVISLYKGHGPGGITAALEGISTVLIDLQDAGMRHYTYISMMYKALEFAAANHKKVIILDRPNPLGGVMEGPLVDPNLRSFISIAPVPIRHGMTMGELALYFNKTLLKEPADLHVVAMNNYHRQGSDIVLPLSPNLRSMQSVHGYSFLGMLGEIDPFHTAVGTPLSCRCIMLPKKYEIPQKKWIALSIGLKKFGINSTAYTYYNEPKRQEYTGLLTVVPHIEQASSLNALLYIVDFFKKEGVAFNFRINHDKAFGSPALRNYLQGAITRTELLATINQQTQQFHESIKPFLLYEPTPKIVLLS
jgi:hypothetical protein